MADWGNPIGFNGKLNPNLCYGWAGTDEEICRVGDALVFNVDGVKRHELSAIIADWFQGAVLRYRFLLNSNTPTFNMIGSTAEIQANSGGGIIRLKATGVVLGISPGARCPVCVWMANNSGGFANAGDVGILDPGAADSWVTIAAANSKSPLVVFSGAGAGGSVAVAVAGKVASVACDAAAVNIGDTLVTSATAGQATVNNAQADPSLILGHAVTAKAGGAAGPVNVLIQR